MYSNKLGVANFLSNYGIPHFLNPHITLIDMNCVVVAKCKGAIVTLYALAQTYSKL